MALKDCIKKFKGVINRSDVDRLKELLASGMTDAEAVRALIVESEQKVVSIASRAQAAGAKVVGGQTVLDDVRSFAKGQEKKLRTRLAEIEKQSGSESQLSLDMNEISAVEGDVKHWKDVSVDIYDDAALRQRIIDMFFDPVMGDKIRKGEIGANWKGKTPIELFNNFREMQGRKDVMRGELLEYVTEGQEITNQLMTMGLRSTDTLYQNAIGFTSGLMTAAQTSRMEKGSAQQWSAYLRKQPGVTPAEMEWLEIDEFLALNGNGASRGELIEYIANNGIQVEETVLGGSGRLFPTLIQEPASDQLVEDLMPAGADPGSVGILQFKENATGKVFHIIDDRGTQEISVRDPNGNYLDLTTTAALGQQTMADARMAIERYFGENPIPGSTDGPTHAQTQSLEGGSNYREIMLSMPEVGPAPENPIGLQEDFTFSHFAEASNILGWFRVKDRVGEDGKKILFVEEVQSDWHQRGRLFGYKDRYETRVMRQKLTALNNDANAMAEDRLPNNQMREEKRWHENRNQADVIIADLDRLVEKQSVPDAPFKNNAWVALVMKRVVRMAAEGGYDQIAWTTGEQQVERNSQLRKIAGTIIYNPMNQSLDALNHQGDLIVTEVVPRQKLPAFIGREMTNTIEAEITKQGSNPDQVIRIEGDEIQVGGFPMQNFYDNTLGNVTQKAARKLDRTAKTKQKIARINVREGEPFTMQARMVPYQPMFHMKPLEATTEDPPLKKVPEYHILNQAGNTIAGPLKDKAQAEKLLSQYQNTTVQVHGMDITPQMKEAALEGQTLFQKAKGSITFDESRQAIIRLFESRDLSTLLHESGHLYLEMLGTMAEMDNAPAQIRDDWAKILEYLNVSNRAQITREHHEFWAMSFEKYLKEGNAPSVALQDAFNSFRRWLTEIWARMTKSPDAINLNAEIRGVMDRILASDVEIAEARSTQEFSAIFSTAEQMGVSQEVFKAYQREIVRSTNDAIEKQTKKTLAAMQRDERAWWRDEKAKMRNAVTAEAHDNKGFQALAFLQNGTNPDGSESLTESFKLSKDDLVNRYGVDFLKNLPRPFVYSREGGVDADYGAKALGYSTANDLMQALVRLPKMKDWITAETDARMRQQFPDPAIDGEMVEHATRIVHNERQGQILTAEMRQLRKLQRRDRAIVRATKLEAKRAAREGREANRGTLPKRAELALIKKAAQESIASKKIRDVRPQIYLNAERKAGRLAFEAAARADFGNAYNLKRQQLVNHEMFRAATKAKEDAAKTQVYLTKFNKPSVQQRLGKLGVLDRILAVLEAVDLAKVTIKELDRRDSLQQLANDIHSGKIVVEPAFANELYRVMTNEKGDETVVLNEDFGTNWQDMTIDQFQGLRDVVKQIEHEASLSLEMPVNGEMVVLEDAIREVVDNIFEANNVVDLGVGEKTSGKRRKEGFRSGIAHWLGPSVLGTILDGQGWGAVTRLMMVNIRRAMTERLLPQTQKAMADVAGLYREHYSSKELGKFGEKQFAQINGEWLSKSDVLSIALNMGNDGNTQALFNGMRADGKPAYPENQVRAAVAKLDARDWTFVQGVWDYLESYWPALSQSMKERKGVAAKQVEATAFTQKTSDGRTIQMRGGYYPLAYNQDHSDRTKAQKFDDHYANMGNSVYVSASTKAGATFERVKNHKMVVQLGLHRIDVHLKAIIRDMSIGNEINFVKNLLNDKDVRNAFKQTDNDIALRELNLWLTDAAVGELAANNVPERWMAWARVGFTKSKLAYNIYTTALQLTGVFQSAAVIGSKSMAMGVGRLMANPAGAWKEAFEASAFLRIRYDKNTLAFDKDVQDTSQFLQSAGSGLPTNLRVGMDKLSRSFFWPIAKMQQMVDTITWLGAYHKGRNELGQSDAASVLYADAQVELAQTSGIYSDRSGIERGTLSVTTRQSQAIRLWTTLISYMLRKGNIAYGKGVELRKDMSFRNAAQFSGDMLLLFTLEGLASAFIYGRWPDDDDEETFLEFAATETALSVISGVPVVREIPAAAYGSGTTPIGALTNDLFDLYTQSLQGEADTAARKAFVNSFGTLFHLPASQTNRLLEALLDEDDPEILEYLTGTRD